MNAFQQDIKNRMEVGTKIRIDGWKHSTILRGGTVAFDFAVQTPTSINHFHYFNVTVVGEEVVTMRASTLLLNRPDVEVVRIELDIASAGSQMIKEGWVLVKSLA